MTTSTKRDLGEFPADPLQVALSLAIANADVTSKTTVAEGASVTAGQTANVLANGTVNTTAKSTAGAYEDGRAGLAFSLGFSNADLDADVAGTVVSEMGPGSVVKLEFDPTVGSGELGFVDLDEASPTFNTIFVGANALKTGDKVNYSARRGNSIGTFSVPDPTTGLTPGLRDGEDYFVIKDPANPEHIQLATTSGRASSGDALLLGQDFPGTVAGGASTNTKVFDPATAADGDDETIVVDNPALSGTGLDFALLGSTFQLGQAVVYDAGGGTPIGGLEDGQTYYVITGTNQFNLQGDLRFVDQQVIQLAESENEALAGVAIDSDPSVATGSDHSFAAKHVLDSGFTTGAGVHANLSASDTISASAGLSVKEKMDDEDMMMMGMDPEDPDLSRRHPGFRLGQVHLRQPLQSVLPGLQRQRRRREAAARRRATASS